MKIKLRRVAATPAALVPITVHRSFDELDDHPYFKPYRSLDSAEYMALSKHPLVKRLSLYQGYIACIGHDDKILVTSQTAVFDSRYPKGDVTYRDMEDARTKYAPRPNLQIPERGVTLSMSDPDSDEPTRRVRVLGGGKLRIAIRSRKGR